MKFYDLMVKNLKIRGLINSIFGLTNDDNKVGVEFSTGSSSNPFIGYDKRNKELVGTNDGVNFFPLYNGNEKPLMVEKISENGFINVSIEDGFPVGIIAPNNAIIPIQKETLTLQDNIYSIKLSAYISYAGLENDNGTWKVYVAAGSRGTKGDPGESLNLTIGSVVSGTAPSVELVGDSPNQKLNFVLPSFGDSFEIVRTSTNNKIFVSSKAIPVMIQTGNGKYYNIRGKEISLSDDKTKFIIDISNALIVNNTSVFSGDWVVYFAGNVENTVSNIPFSPSEHGVGSFDDSPKEIFLDTYFVQQKSFNMYHKSNANSEFNLSIYVDSVKNKEITLSTSTVVTKSTIVLDAEITGSVKLVCNNISNTEIINICKIEG